MPTAPMAGQGRDRWLWIGMVETDVKLLPLNQGEDEVKDVFWHHVPHGRVLIALNSRREDGPHAHSILSAESTESIRVLAIPLTTVTSEDTSFNMPRTNSTLRRPVTFDAYVPILWDPRDSTSKFNGSSTHSPPDFHIKTSTSDAPLISVHTLIISSRSSYFRMLLSSSLSEPTSLSPRILSEDISTASPSTTMDEDYFVVYAYIHWLYTDTLPQYLLTTTTRSSSVPPFMKDSAHPSKVLVDLLTAADKYLEPLDGGLCLSIRKALMLEPGHISIENALYVWKAAWSLTPENLRDHQGALGDPVAYEGSREAPGDSLTSEERVAPVRPPPPTPKVTLVRCRSSTHPHSRLSLSSHENGGHLGLQERSVGATLSSPTFNHVSIIPRDEERWIDKAIREAYVSRVRQAAHPTKPFLGEVNRWCARRVDEIELLHGYDTHYTDRRGRPSSIGMRPSERLPGGPGYRTIDPHLTPESNRSRTSKDPSRTSVLIATATPEGAENPQDPVTEISDDEVDGHSDGEESAFGVESEVRRAFWQEMRRLGAIPSGREPLTKETNSNEL